MLLIRNANIKTMAGPDLKNGCLLLENGKIAAVGQTLAEREAGSFGSLAALLEGVPALRDVAIVREAVVAAFALPYRPRQRGHALGGHGL